MTIIHHLVPIALAGLTACGHPAPQPATRSATVPEIALRFARAAWNGDRAEALSLVVTHEELAEMSTKAIAPAVWDAEVTELLDKLAEERAGDTEQIAFVSARVIKAGVLAPPADRKVKRPVEYAVVLLTATERGKEREVPMPLLFVKTDAGWRFSPRK